MSSGLPHYSVLMSTYRNDNAEYLDQAIASMAGQTVGFDDFVLVCDGPLDDALEEVIAKWTESLGASLKIVRLVENLGLGKALGQGLPVCACEYVARMDSDDIAEADRCEKQLSAFAADSSLSVVSGAIEEFEANPGDRGTVRALPTSYEEVVRFSKKRNPFNHPCVMFKKIDVLSVGGYQDFYKLEDYYLWIRLLSGGYRGINLPDTLLNMRVGNGMHNRRKGLRYLLSQIGLLNYMRKIKYINSLEWLEGVVLRSLAAAVPTSALVFIYDKRLRATAN